MTSMSIPYELKKNKFHMTSISKSWPMKFMMLEHMDNPFSWVYIKFDPFH
jgi:hypothetical protein